MGIGFRELIVILLIVVIVFGLGKLPKVMKDLGKGIKEFKDGMAKDDTSSNDTEDKK